MLQIGSHELVLQSTRITWVNIHMQLCIYIYIYMHTHVRIYVHSCLHLYTRMYGHRHRHKFSLISDVAHCWFDGQCLTKRTDLVSRLGSPLLPFFFRVLAQLSQSYTIKEHHSRRIASSIHHDHEQSIWTWTSYRCCNKYLFASTLPKHVVLSWLDKPPLSKNVGNMLMLSKYSLATNVDNCLIMFACLHHSMHWRKHKDAKIGYWISRGSGIWTLVHCLTDHRANPLKSKTRPRRENRLQPLFWQAIETIWKKTLKNQVVPFLEPKLVPKMKTRTGSLHMV